MIEEDICWQTFIPRHMIDIVVWPSPKGVCVDQVQFSLDVECLSGSGCV